MECPTNSKLLEVLEQITGHVYQHSTLFLQTQVDLVLTLVKNDVKICSKLHKKFNPSLTMILLKLVSSDVHSTKLAKIYETYLSKVLATMPAAQILQCELEKAISNNKKLLKKRNKIESEEMTLTTR